MKQIVLLLAAALTLAVLAGSQSFGRLALWTGHSGLAARWLTDPASKGIALWRSGQPEAADAQFEAAGRSQTFNRALTLAATGQYALATAYFDAVLFANPADAEARRLRDLVAAFVEPVTGQSIAPGRLAASGGGDTYQPLSDNIRPSTPDPSWQRKVDARGFAASETWVRAIDDDPGEFLRLRLQSEYDRRSAMGLARPAEGDPW
jgi:Ca-activated chloride channel family protein